MTKGNERAQPGASLIRYDAACRALAEAKAVDEVKDLRDKAEAMRIYGMQAKNKTLEVDAAEIRIRAERRLGELIAAQKATVGLNPGKLKKGAESPVVVSNDHGELPTLADVGITKDLSSRSQKLAAVPEHEFEAEVGEWRDRVKAEGARVTTRLEKAGERALEKKPKPEPTGVTETLHARIAELEAENENLREQNAELAQQCADTLADNESMAKVFEANDKIGEALAEAKKYREMNRLLEERIRGLQGERNAAISTAKSSKARLEKAEKKLAELATA